MSENAGRQRFPTAADLAWEVVQELFADGEYGLDVDATWQEKAHKIITEALTAERERTEVVDHPGAPLLDALRAGREALATIANADRDVITSYVAREMQSIALAALPQIDAVLEKEEASDASR